ncbi:glycosyltransferase [Halanaeroarchaeum sulfurireducens]|uniref:Glycosyltransferase n=1 Tax=Halanaeroarchaeum sulfurireducens TaxID=1604004 RepID=A0A0F7PB94_9EURY|nr:glycosyltransferase [Halanaeroarchaeum sulfurireducens]AKH97425.1 glycosyltransferase [Halanaeroarchaeum sulfurireducens]
MGMDICYLINQLAPGGAPTLLLDIVRQIDREDISFTVAFIEGDDTLVSDFEDAGAEVVSFDADFKFDPRALWRLFRFFRQRSFDIVHTHLPYAQTLGRLGSLIGEHGAVVSTQHNFQKHYHPITRNLEKATQPIDDTTVGVSKAVVEDFGGSTHSTDWRVIYNGADIESIRRKIKDSETDNLYETEGLSPDDHIILSVGRYVEQKRQKDIIRAIERRDMSSQLILVGWGPKESLLKETAKEYEIADRVTVTGRVSEVWPYYAVADTFVSASKLESFGIVFLEAMAADLPIIATEVPGAKEVLEQAESGVQSVPPGDILALAEVLEQSLNEPPTVDYTEAMEKFDIRKIASEHIELYEELQREI